MLHRKIVKSCCYWTRVFQKFLSTVENPDILESKTSKKKSSKQKSSQRSTISQELRYILGNNDLDHYVDILPQAMLKRRSNVCTGMHFVNSDNAKLCCSMISKELLKTKTFVVETNPGFGFLTQELLSTGIYPIHLYEKCDKFLEPESPLTDLIHAHQNKLQAEHLNFSHIWMTLLHDKFFNENNAEVYFKNVPHRDWKDKTYMQIIVATNSRRTLALIVHNFFNQTVLFEYGRPSFYVIVPSYIWERFTKDHTDPDNHRFYSQYNVMFYLFFNYKRLGILPSESFIPWSCGKLSEKSKDGMTVLQLEPKINAFNVIEKSDVRHFWFFLKYCMRTKRTRVIREFEKLVPGCGPKLIQQNFHILTTFKELDPNTLLQLFLNFKSWPEYDENSFMPAREIKKYEEEELEQELNELDSQASSTDAS